MKKHGMDKFKRGDKVILIDIDGIDDQDFWCSIKLYEEYEIEEYAEYTKLNGELKSVTILKGVSGAFHGSRFISIMDYRKQKINKLLSKYG